MSKRDYYDVLGVAKGASDAEIKKAYRKAAMKNHPDKFSGASEQEKHDAEVKFKEANDAYQVLSDSTKKGQYDRFGHAAFEQGGAGGAGGFGGFGGGGFGDFEDLGDIFGSFFGGGGGGSQRRRVQPGADLRYTVEITLEESAKGVEKDVKYKRKASCNTCNGTGAKPGTEMHTCSQCGGQGRVKQVQRTMLGNFENVVECPACEGNGKVAKTKCGTCHGTGIDNETVERTVKIPAGIDDGQRLRLSGLGEASSNGGPNGDLYIYVKVRKHSVFERMDDDIVCEVPISYTIATLGGEIKIPTLDGELKMKVPAGTQTGKVFKLREKGMPSMRGYRNGDQLVKVVVEVPVKLNDKQEELLRAFEASLKDKNYEMKTSFFSKLKKMFK